MDLFYQEADIEDSIFETTIDMYIESAISIIESMENVALIRASYFTEASKDNEKEVSDKMHYQDDYIRKDLYDFYTKYDIADGRQSNHVTFSLCDPGCRLVDAVNLIVTQEFPEHSFDS